MSKQADVSFLEDEYRLLIGVKHPTATEVGDVSEIEDVLVRKGDWSPYAANHIVSLASRYGSFMLRNALAVALVLEIEDGDLGF